MKIKHYELRSNLSIEEIENNIYMSTRLVEFGPADLYNSQNKTFTESWLGEYSNEANEFKLFKTIVGTENTSDFYITGKLSGKHNHTYIRYAIKTHYMLVVALAGINVFSYSVIFLSVGKGWLPSIWFALPLCLIVSFIFVYSKIQDFIMSKLEFENMMTNNDTSPEQNHNN